jgi:hypothetical protein
LYAPGRIIALLYGAAIAGIMIGRSLAYFAEAPLGPIAVTATSVLVYATVILAMAWLHAAWTGIPQSHRGTVSPRRAALSLLIPLYNVYWALAVNLALCDTLDRILARSSSSRRAPRTLAAVAWVAWLGCLVLNYAFSAADLPPTIVRSLLTTAITGGLWLAYMVQCDRARDEVARLGDGLAKLDTPELSQLQRRRGPGALAIGAIWWLVIMGLGCWQILSPGERAPRHDSEGTSR